MYLLDTNIISEMRKADTRRRTDRLRAVGVQPLGAVDNS